MILHYHPSNASFAPHVLLNEIGAPFELALVDRAQAAHKSAGYLQLNPNGLIPVLQDGDLVLYETAAICLHLADTHPAAALAPPLATAARAQLYKWLVWMSATLQSRLIVYFYPERYGDAAPSIKRQAEAAIAAMLQQLDDQLASHGGPWLLGGAYTLADPYALMLCRWTRGFANEAPARDRPHLGPYLQRVLARPAVQKTIAAEGLQPPLV